MILIGIIFLAIPAGSPVLSLNFFEGLFRSTESTTERDYQQNSCEDVRTTPRLALAIMGGTPVQDKKSVPYMAAIGERTNSGEYFWFCGGALLTDRIVVTAAHCLLKEAHVVRLGGTSLNPNSSSQNIAVESKVIHPEYRSPQSYHDIALLRLATRVNLSQKVRPICLAGKNAGQQPGEETSVMGWGATNIGGEGNAELRHVKVQIFLNAECDRVYLKSKIANTTFPQGITDEQICAGSPEGGKDACRGDSGGPLVVEENGVIRLLGIVTSGMGCGIKGVPGVYIRLSSYKDWLEKFL